MAEQITFLRTESYQLTAGVLRPAVYYRLIYEGRASNVYLGIVDSGADYIMVPSLLAADLGLDLAQLPTRRFVGPDGGYYRRPYALATIHCQGSMVQAEIFFSGLHYAFLGRAGFFEHFVFGIDEANQRVLIQPNPS